jgi:hypothetical protein
VGILSALPETQLYRRLAKEGRLKEHGEWTGNNTHNLELSFKPVMNEETLIQGYKNIISTIYSPKEYFERCKLLISRLPTPAAFYSRKVTFNDIRAFILSFFTQIFSRYSLTYLRFMANTMINKPALFPKAVEFAVKGHHLFTITKDILTADKFAAELEDAKSSITSHLLHFNRPDGTMPLHARARARAMRKITHIRNSMFWRYRLLRRDVRIYLEDSLADFDAHSKDNLRLLDHYDM